MKQRSLLAWTLVLLGSALGALVPFVYFRATLGTWLPSVLPELEADSLYYLVQIHEVLNGYPWLGNPYILAHADAHFPGLLLPIWIAAIPGFFGAGINALFALNALLFSIITGALLFILCKKTSEERLWTSVVLAILGTASLHNLLIRPAVMQTIYPFFALFLLAMLSVLRRPHALRPYLWLGLTTAFSFYLYPYLWMVTFAAVGLLSLSLMWRRDWLALRALAVMGFCVGLACLPHILTILSLFRDEASYELNLRIGLVKTHVVLPLTITNNKYTIALLLGLLVLRIKRKFSPAETLLFLAGSAIILGAVSNVITGQEMDFHSHFWRLGLLLNIVALAVLLAEIRQPTPLLRAAVGASAVLLLFATCNRTCISMNAYSYLLRPPVARAKDRSIQGYQRPFDYFNQKEIAGKSILAPMSINRYLALYTDNYLLFSRGARYHVIPNDELLERFLIQNSGHVDRQMLTDNIIAYAGVGPVHASTYSAAYDDYVSAIDLFGGEAFLQKTMEHAKDVDRNYDRYLQKYDVQYVVVDKNDAANPRLPSRVKSVYSDDRFTIYETQFAGN